MSKLHAIILLAILGVAAFGATEYHEETQRAEHERQEQALDACWQNAVQYGTGGDTCKALADSMNH